MLNGGRPQETRQVLQPPDDTTWDGLRRVADGLYWDLGRVAGALYWDQDTSGAEAAVHRFATLGRGSMRPGRAGMSHLRALCITAIWRAERGRLEPDDQTAERLRRAVPRGVSAWDSVRATQYATVCAALLDAMQAVELHRPDASVKVAAADEAARTYNLIESVPVNLIVARLWEATGNLPLALRAVRRRSGDNGPKFQPFLSSFLREEGRLATLAGDTGGAIRAYRHFLMLRPDPEPELRWESDHVSAELQRLEKSLDR